MPHVTGKGLFCQCTASQDRERATYSMTCHSSVTRGHTPSPLLLLVEVTACQVCQLVNITWLMYSADPLIYSFCDMPETTSWWAFLSRIQNGFKLERVHSSQAEATAKMIKMKMMTSKKMSQQ